jgi:D-beta-D-heptose 7-phosphate kinase/D-beta-D-heptose 1-phosphate adenosyltransferase
MGKALSAARAAALRERLRRLGRRVVFTNGCFDLLHVGHVALLEKARALGDVLVVGVNTDRSVRLLKGPGRPVVPLAERMEILAGLEAVDIVVPFPDRTPVRLIAALRPDILVKGDDYRPSEIAGRKVVEAAGGRVVRVRLSRGRSTSGLIRRVLRAAAGRVRGR